MNIPTLHSKRTDAELCRENGWKPGSRLVGDEGHGPTVIEITAVGESYILAKDVTHNGHEGLWNLSWRDWQPVPPSDDTREQTP